jgi:hypothetical protein
MPSPSWTREAKKKEGYEDYDLSPPKLPDRTRRTFEQAVKAIQNDFHELKVEWVGKEEFSNAAKSEHVNTSLHRRRTQPYFCGYFYYM